jgi:hypothetical protein
MGARLRAMSFGKDLLFGVSASQEASTSPIYHRRYLTPATGLFGMKLVQNSMDNGRQDDAHDSYENQTAEECIPGSEELSPGGPNWTDWAHPAQNHRGFKERVNPGQTSQPMISRHADE